MKQDLSFEMLAGGLEYLLVLDQLSAVDQDLSLVMLAGRGNVCWYRNSRLWSGICCLGGGGGGWNFCCTGTVTCGGEFVVGGAVVYLIPEWFET